MGSKYSNFSEGDLYFIFTKLQEAYPNHPRLEEIKQAKEAISNNKWQILKSRKIYDLTSYLQPSSEVRERRDDMKKYHARRISYAAELAKDKENRRLAEGKALLDKDGIYQKIKNEFITYFNELSRVEINVHLVYMMKHFG